MSSFSCPHLNFRTEQCERLNKICVPGRPGCVLAGKVQFAIPAKERIKEKEKEKPSSNINKNKH